jgi:hypothetical protein
VFYDPDWLCEARRVREAHWHCETWRLCETLRYCETLRLCETMKRDCWRGFSQSLAAIGFLESSGVPKLAAVRGRGSGKM